MKVEKKKHEISEGQGKVVCVEKGEVKSFHEMVLEHSSVLELPPPETLHTPGLICPPLAHGLLQWGGEGLA